MGTAGRGPPEKAVDELAACASASPSAIWVARSGSRLSGTGLQRAPRAGPRDEPPQPRRVGIGTPVKNPDRNLALEPGIPGAVDLAGVATAQGRPNLVRPQTGSGGDRHVRGNSGNRRPFPP